MTSDKAGSNGFERYNLKISTSACDGIIEQRLTDLTENVHLWIAKTRDDQLIKALCDLGWMTPEKSAELKAKAKAMLDNPYPHDLFTIRREVAAIYGGDEAEAKKGMEAYCTEDYCVKQYLKHENAKEELRKAVEG